MKYWLKTPWGFVAAMLIGVIITVLLVNNRSQPQLIPIKETAKSVYTINTPTVNVTPIVVSQGSITPSHVWRGVSETRGKIIHMHPQLKKGGIISQEAVLFNVDPTDYELAIAQAQAIISINQAQLNELVIKERNTRTLANLELAALSLSENELERKDALFKSHTLSQTKYDEEKRQLLTQQKSLATLNNTLSLYPTQQSRLKAERKKLDAQLKSAELDLKRTTVMMPFTGRISEVNIDIGQFISPGETLVIADGMDKAEVTIQIPINRLSHLVRSSDTDMINLMVNHKNQLLLDLSATINLIINKKTISWEGTVVRISDSLDLTTRTIGVIVEINDPYKDVIPGERPPLIKGLFVSVELKGKQMKKQLTLPRSAISQSQVLVVNSENRLETRNITVGLVTQNFATITTGLSQGERVIVSDVIPVIEGMLLSPVNDINTYQSLIKSAGISQ